MNEEGEEFKKLNHHIQSNAQQSNSVDSLSDSREFDTDLIQDMPPKVLAQVTEQFDFVPWSSALIRLDFYMYMFTFGFVGFIHEGLFVWVIQFMGNQYSNDPTALTSAIVVLCLSGLISLLVSLVANNGFTLEWFRIPEKWNNLDFLPMWNIVMLVVTLGGLLGFLFANNSTVAVICLGFLILGRDCTMSTKHLVCMTMGGFQKTGRMSSFFNSFVYIGSALGTLVFYELYMRNVSTTAWKVVLVLPIVFALICMLILSMVIVVKYVRRKL